MAGGFRLAKKALQAIHFLPRRRTQSEAQEWNRHSCERLFAKYIYTWNNTCSIEAVGSGQTIDAIQALHDLNFKDELEHATTRINGFDPVIRQ